MDSDLPPLAHRGEVAAGADDEVVRPDAPGRGLDLFVGGAGTAVGDVVADRRRKQEGLLGDVTEAPAITLEVQLGQWRSVDQDLTRGRVVKAGDEFHDRRLPGPGLADERHRLPRRDGRSMPATASAGCPGYRKCTPASSMAPVIFGSGRSLVSAAASAASSAGWSASKSRLTGACSRPEIRRSPAEACW